MAAHRYHWQRSVSPEDIAPGDIVACYALGVRHEGLVSDAPGPDGFPLIINKSKRTGRVVEEPFSDFAGGRRVFLVGFPGDRCPCCVVRDARARIGEPWSMQGNCQHFTRECHGLGPVSPEVNQTATAVGVVAVCTVVGALSMGGLR